jgi:hypothetical protein
LFCYDAISVPAGVLLEDADKIVPRDDLFLVDGNVGAFTDLFRYKVIETYGEWWVDTDVFCLKDDIPECDYAWASEDQDNINGAILKFPSNDPTLHEISRDAHAIGSKSTTWCELGPHLLTKHLAEARFEKHFGNRDQFYPIHWLEIFLFWLPNHSDAARSKCKGAFFLHFWNSLFKRVGIDRYQMPPVGSFLNTIYAPHISRFTLRDLDSGSYQQTFALMREFISPQSAVSQNKLGYDVTKMFDELVSQGESA